MNKVIEQMAQQLAESMSAQHDELIKDAIAYGLGVAVVSTEQIKELDPERGRVDALPDGKEIFCFDHIPLIEFYPVAFNTSCAGLSSYWNATQHYRKLYNNNNDDGGKL